MLDPARWDRVAADLWCALLDLRGSVPDGATLLLGGSFGRGEPCWREVAGGAVQLSDLDLLLVVPDDASADTGPLWAAMTGGLVRPTLVTVTETTFRSLGTDFGRSFKVDGCCISSGALPAIDHLPATARDFAEGYLYAIVEIVAAGALRRDPQADLATEHLWHRITLNLLWSAAKVHGALTYHDVDGLPAALAEAVGDELRWRDLGAGAAVGPTRFRRALALAHAAHTEVGWLATRRDAVGDSEFEGVPGSAFVAYVHRITFELAEALAERSAPDAGAPEIAALLDRTWGEVAARHPFSSCTPEVDGWFAAQRPFLQDQMLLMKYAAARTLATR